MNHLSTSPHASSMISIGIQGLPNQTADMMNGGLYVLIAELPSARFPLLAGGLGSALQSGHACNVIVPANPELFIRRVESFDCFNAAESISTNQLNFFVMQSEFPKKMFRFGAESFVKELEEFEIREHSYLLFDQADELLSLHDISLALDQIDVLRKWLDQRKVTALLVFSRLTAENSGTINALMDHLTGIARLSGDRDGLEITFDYWQSPEGAITARNYPLLTLDSGLYEATVRAIKSNPLIEVQRPERRIDTIQSTAQYFYIDPDLDSLANQSAGVWQRTDTPMGLLHATRDVHNAVCILSFEGNSNLQQLAETVHTLRVSLGRHAQIVVYEKDASLGHQTEALLARLGANLVIHRDVSMNRVPTILESINGQLFPRDVEVSFEAAIDSALFKKTSPLLSPEPFVREAFALLDTAETAGTPCAMVTGKLRVGVTTESVTQTKPSSRPGDMLCCIGEYCCVFLNACPQSDIVNALEQVLGMSVSAAFDEPQLFINREEVQPELLRFLSMAQSMSPAESLFKVPSQQRYDPAPAVRPTNSLPLMSMATPTQVALAGGFRSEHRITPVPTPTPTPKIARSVVPTLKISPDKPVTSVGYKAPADTAVMTSKIDANRPSHSVQRQQDTPPDLWLFSYDEASANPSFGKKDVPRAMRSGSKERTEDLVSS